jgi:TPR repeat protein
MKRIATLVLLTALPAFAQVATESTVSADPGIARVFSSKPTQGRNKVERNPVAMEAAARAGDAESAYELGKVYEYGLLGATPDESRSIMWYRAAAELGHRGAQFEAGIAYYKGQGVARDKAEAAKWWTVAMANGDSVPDWMRVSVESAEAKLAPEEIAEGRRRAREWLAKK